MENANYREQIATAYADSQAAAPGPWRPGYHLTPLAGTLGDPNGLCQVGDTYHIFYVTSPLACRTTQRTPCVWGHYTTKDFVHYRRETIPVTGTASTAGRRWKRTASCTCITPATSGTPATLTISMPGGSRTCCGWKAPTASTSPARPC